MSQREYVISILFGFAIFSCTLSFVRCSTFCKINRERQFHKDQPLILNAKHNIVYPTLQNPNELTLKGNARLYVACPGGSLSTSPSHHDYDRLMCQGENLVDSLNKSLTFESVNCGLIPESIVRSSGKPCNNGNVVEIGFQLVGNGDFVKTIEACFSNKPAITNWVHYVVPNVISFPQRIDIPGNFKTGGFFKGLHLSNAYMTRNQHIQFLRIFRNDTSLVNKYLSDPMDGRYLDKGHLAAKADFYYAAERSSTYYYVNAVPMWKSINNGNWKVIEGYVRSHLASSTEGGLDVYTGVLDVLRLPDSRGVMKSIFLARDRDNEDAVPVPKFLIKIGYDSKKHEGIVFVTVNNPYLDLGSPESDYIICKVPTVCQNHPTFGALKKVEKGYTYCCAYKDFVKNNPQLGLPKALKSMRLIKMP